MKYWGIFLFLFALSGIVESSTCSNNYLMEKTILQQNILERYSIHSKALGSRPLNFINYDKGFGIITNKNHPMQEVLVEKVLKDFSATYEKLDFFGKVVFHVF
ncbi:MAG: hypothetical protein AB8E15_10370 [Bdellovibrionales bacterium]